MQQFASETTLAVEGWSRDGRICSQPARQSLAEFPAPGSDMPSGFGKFAMAFRALPATRTRTWHVK